MNESDVIIERLEQYSAEDAAGIGRLMPFLSQELGGEPIPEELLTEIINSPYHEQLIARLDSRIVGSATLNILMGPAVHKAGYLEDFVVDSEIRGHGIGGKLWEEMMTWCEEYGVSLNFTSHSGRTDAHRFYLARNAQIRDTTVFQVASPVKE